jgi:hypothetical protein
MLVACRLAGLSALEGALCGRQRARAIPTRSPLEAGAQPLVKLQRGIPRSPNSYASKANILLQSFFMLTTNHPSLFASS